MGAAHDQLRRIPAVDRLLSEPQIIALTTEFAHATIVALIREELDERRRGILAGTAGAEAFAPEAIARMVAQRARGIVRPPLRRVLNATGVLIHTNLGRSPLCAAAQEAVARVAGGYASLEMDLETGGRASRLDDVRELLRRVTGAPDAFAVHNNAAAVFLILQALARDREVIVSRGELVEIGGSFRLPDIMAASGVRLREVGTTNRTRIEDYAAAISGETGLILRVHPSNFVIAGFTERPGIDELVALARARSVPCVEDIGSGALTQHPEAFLRSEPRVQPSLAAGVDLVCFSGDKLLGGPQAGIILGRGELIERLRAHPVARIVRLEKILLCALEATLLEYLRGPEGLAHIPLHRMATRPMPELRAIGDAIVSELAESAPPGWSCELRETKATAGGGSLPGETLPSIGIAIRTPAGSIDAFAHALRCGDPAVVGRIERDRLILDLRALNEEEQAGLARVLSERMAAFSRSLEEGSGDAAGSGR
jgi:L-seryl-tRNA(Ser) seleniumtransferase